MKHFVLISSLLATALVSVSLSVLITKHWLLPPQVVVVDQGKIIKNLSARLAQKDLEEKNAEAVAAQLGERIKQQIKDFSASKKLIILFKDQALVGAPDVTSYILEQLEKDI